jgi:hypothetical protein
MDIPVYELMIKDDSSEVDYISLVDLPATERDFVAFNQKQVYKIENEERRIISGPLMLADKLIFRTNDEMGNHYVKFSKETIQKIAIKYAKRGYQKNVNVMHDDELKLESVVLFESFITDAERGIMPMKGYEDVPDGSWFGSMYVENDEAWQAVKDNKLKGFSVEGFFDYEKPKMSAEMILNKVISLLNLPITK